jgi:hypothetical protein
MTMQVAINLSLHSPLDRDKSDVVANLALHAICVASDAIEKGCILNEKSAKICLNDALYMFSNKEYTSALERASRSVEYSRGIFSDEYRQIMEYVLNK